ncbi:MAG: peptide chain release factor N(5)-glutamine methyltransferase [Ruminococcaceae bacterium]|nr:peptide chain release factor N(5)-glutamine methyltransferase [Oscillospiraceae bacterium]
MVIRTLLQEAGIPRLDAEVLLCHVLGVPREKLLFLYNETAAEETAAAFSALCEKRRTGYPVAYLTGEKEFFSLPFYVDENTLIPRPDTETLVEWAIERAAGVRMLDLCCGTGCIGIAVAKNAPLTTLTLADISVPALSVAKKNAERHSVLATLLHIDILNEALSGTYDLIVSNPPYIETDVIPTLSRDVCAFEPHLALDGGRDGLNFYPVIIRKAADALSANGWLGLEIGYTQGEAVACMMEPFFTDIRILSDLGSNMRAVVGRKK